MRKATEKQIEYIKILSSYESSKEQDNKIINDFCSNLQKKDIAELTVKEAHNLIDTLLEIPVEYTFKCNRKSILSKEEINRGLIMGECDLCIHSCPFDKDINDCEFWIDDDD